MLLILVYATSLGGTTTAVRRALRSETSKSVRIEKIRVTPTDEKQVLLADQSRLKQQLIVLLHHLGKSIENNRLVSFAAKNEFSDQVIHEIALDLFVLLQNDLFQFLICSF